MQTGLWWENIKKKKPLGRPRNRCSIEIDLKERMG
jgi:hypothetical protein